MTDMTRTIQMRLDLPIEVAEATINEWLAVCNFVSTVAFDKGCVSNNVRLHKLTYAEVRARFRLSSQMSCNAIRQVASQYAVLRTQKVTLDKPVSFTEPSLTMQHGYDFSYLKDGLSLYTLEGRRKGVGYRVGKYAEKYADWQLGGATLYIRKGKVFLAQSVNKPAPDAVADANLLGVDKGLNFLATVTTGESQRFFAGGKTRHRKKHYLKVRASLQKKKAERNKAKRNTRSVRRTLKRLSGRERRYMADTNHVVSKRIVQVAVQEGCSHIVTENLEGIRERANEASKTLRSLINGWSFYQLQAFLSYKATETGLTVIEIDPRNTSRACSNCGYCNKANRHRHDFLCKACGYRLHSDLNAARNIRQRGILARQVLCQDGLLVSQPQSTDPCAGAASLPSVGQRPTP